MGIEEKVPAGFLLTTVEALAGYMRKSSVWPITFGLACCAIEMMAVGSRPVRHRPVRRGASSAPARARRI